MEKLNFYDTIIVGAGPGGIFTAFELVNNNYKGSVCVLEAGTPLSERHCPINDNKVTSCIRCNHCSIMSGFGGAGAFSDGKYNITNAFGGTLYERIGKDEALSLMEYVDSINVLMGGEDTKTYSTTDSKINKECMVNKLNLLDAKVRHLGTDKNYDILNNLYKFLLSKDVVFRFKTEVIDFDEHIYDVTSKSVYSANYKVYIADSEEAYYCNNLIFSIGRSGSNRMKDICKKHNIKNTSNRVDIGVRVELNAKIFEHITDDLYEGKIVYKTGKFEDNVRTFCMNPHGKVVTENTNGVVTVNGHSYGDISKHTNNTNFALLVSKRFTEPFNDSNAYAESIVKLSNMLGGGVIVQKFGDLIRGRRSTPERIEKGLVSPTLQATPGDLSLVLPKRILDGIIEMIYALDNIAPGTANDDTLLYGVEVKFYNVEVAVDNKLSVPGYKNVYIIGDGSGVTHSLSQASASGVYVARNILEEK